MQTRLVEIIEQDDVEQMREHLSWLREQHARHILADSVDAAESYRLAILAEEQAIAEALSDVSY